MQDQHERIDLAMAAAYVRGVALRMGGWNLPDQLLQKPLEHLAQEELQTLLQEGRRRELKLYRFKNHDDLPRVRMVLGFLRSVQPASLLDVGSGRGVFLFPFMHAFPYAAVTSLDVLKHRVDALQDLCSGGVKNLTALEQDICSWDQPDDSFDVVTMLEVLEHIPDVQSAIHAAVRLAKRYVVVTVPSKPDDNPEHIHLLTKEKLTQLFADAGCMRLRFDGVNGHLFMTANVTNDI